MTSLTFRFFYAKYRLCETVVLHDSKLLTISTNDTIRFIKWPKAGLLRLVHITDLSQFVRFTYVIAGLYEG
jgi:hypothetical protein